MLAAVLYRNDDICVERIRRPEPGEGEVLVRVHAAGICGSDIPRVLNHGAHSYPIVLGHEFSGIVEQTGPNVTRVSVGQSVAAAPLLPCMRCADCARGDYAQCGSYSFIGSRRQGAFAEYVVLPEMNAVPFDSAISFRQGAMFEPSAVALHGLLQCDYRGGYDTAVLGGGTIGQFTAQWARIFGARTVTVFDLDESRLDLAKRLGADTGITASADGFMDEVRRLVPGGFGVVFETAGSVATMRLAFELAANKARVCIIGTPRASLTFEPSIWELLNRKEFLLTGSWMGYSAPFPGREWDLTASAFASGALRFDEDLIHAVLPLEQTAQAFEMLKTPGMVSGRILLEP